MYLDNETLYIQPQFNGIQRKLQIPIDSIVAIQPTGTEISVEQKQKEKPKLKLVVDNDHDE